MQIQKSLSLKFFQIFLNIKRRKLQWNGFFWNNFRYECLGNQRIAATFCSVLVNTFARFAIKESGANKKTRWSRKNYVLKREFASEVWETDSYTPKINMGPNKFQGELKLINGEWVFISSLARENHQQMFQNLPAIVIPSLA